jgi:hypothetical protein
MHTAVINALNNPAMRNQQPAKLLAEAQEDVCQNGAVSQLGTERKAPAQERSESVTVVAESAQAGQ